MMLIAHSEEALFITACLEIKIELETNHSNGGNAAPPLCKLAFDVASLKRNDDKCNTREGKFGLCCSAFKRFITVTILFVL